MKKSTTSILLLLGILLYLACESEAGNHTIRNKIYSELSNRNIPISGLNIEILDTIYISDFELRKLQLANLQGLDSLLNARKDLRIRQKFLLTEISSSDYTFGDWSTQSKHTVTEERILDYSARIEEDSIAIRKVQKEISDLLSNTTFSEKDSFPKLYFHLFGEVNGVEIVDTFQIIFSPDYRIYFKGYFDDLAHRFQNSE